ncbi:hypothetical protein D3C72_1644980 [compost metagenome]
MRPARPVDQPVDGRERDRLAQPGADAPRLAAHLAGDAGLRQGRLPHRGHHAGRAQGQAPCSGAAPATERQPRSGLARQPLGARLGQPLRPGGQRGKRQRRAGGHRTDQWRGRHHPGGAALLHAIRAGSQRGRGGALSAHGCRDRHPVQGERLDLRCRSRLPGRGRGGLFDGGRGLVRGAWRHGAASRERR